MKQSSILILLLLCSTVVVFAQLASKEVKKIDSLFVKWNTSAAPGLAVAVLTDKKIIYSKGFGSANLEYNIPINSKTIFDLASLSKQFTAFAIAILVDSGKLTLADDVRIYIPGLYNFGKKITIENLLTHTSGLRDQNELLYLSGWKEGDMITNEDILNLIYHQKELNFLPGEQFKYCNSGYTLLAQVVESVTKTPFAIWTTENIFKPLNMQNTFFITSNYQLIKNRAYSYSSGESSFEKSIFNSTAIGARGLQSTIEDLSKWVLNFTQKSIYTESVYKMIDARPENSKLNYHFGQTFNTYKGFSIIEHDGSDAAYRTYIGRFPEQHYSFIVLSNSSAINPKSIAMQMADIVLLKKPAASTFPPLNNEKIEVPETVEKGMEGQFQISEDRLMTIWADDHALRATINNDEKIYYLKPVSKIQFVINELAATLTYKPDSIVFKSGELVSVLPKVFVENEESRSLLEYEGRYVSEEPAGLIG